MTLTDLISEERLREIAHETVKGSRSVESAARTAALEAVRNALEMAAMKAELSWERALTGPDIRALAEGLKE